MKKISLILVSVFLLILPFFVFAGSKEIGEGNSVQINATLISQDPDPVEPGEVVTVKFKIEDRGKASTEDAIVKIVPKFPFSIYNDVAEKNIGKLRATSIGSDAIVVEFKLRVDENAVEEETELELLVKVAPEVWVAYTNNEFMIDVQTQDAVLDVTAITSEPKQIAPGETAEVTVMVKNKADSLLKEIKFKLDFSSTTLPLAPYQSSSERRIAQLQSNYQNSMTFKIIANPTATPGLYKIPLNITYYDEQAKVYFINDVLAVTVGEVPKVRAYLKKSTVLQPNSAGKVTLEIANAGSSDIKFLEMTLLASEDYQLITPSNYFYLGDVDSDDTESEEIEVYVNKKAETVKIPLLLKYADANNKPFQQQFDLELQLYSASELKRFGVLEKSKAWIYGLVIVLVVLGIFLYRSYRKNPERLVKWSKSFGSMLTGRFNGKK